MAGLVAFAKGGVVSILTTHIAYIHRTGRYAFGRLRFMRGRIEIYMQKKKADRNEAIIRLVFIKKKERRPNGRLDCSVL